VALSRQQALRLAAALRELRESTRPEGTLTQAELADALGVTGATLSSWESKKNPKPPTEQRITAYARFFATQRSLEGRPHLVDQLTEDERMNFRKLESELLDILHGRVRQGTFEFDEGPVVVICPELPIEERGPLADEGNRNFTKLQKYGDLDALIELYGHVRAQNPSLDVYHRLPSDVKSDDYTSHVVLLGGIGWNEQTELFQRFQRATSAVPIIQKAVDDLRDGDIFHVKGVSEEKEKDFYPEFERLGDAEKLVADVAYIARLQNPFKVSRTLTICNGVFSHGVYGAVRSLTDAQVREDNEKYLSDRFPSGEFAMLLRIPIGQETVSPDLQDPHARLYEWPAMEDAKR
jgi:transcriptional regulator with XRE-family HTH domain